MTSSSRPLLVRVLVIRQGSSQWLAQGLDYNLVAQGPGDKHAINAFVRVLRAHLRRDAALGREPLQGVPRAPDHFFSLWDDKRAVLRPLDTSADEAAGIPPAYVVEAVAERAEA